MLGPEQFVAAGGGGGKSAGAKVMHALAGRGYIPCDALCGGHPGKTKNGNIIISIVISMVFITTGIIRSHVLLKQYTTLG